jgi:hypothetical protein
MIPVEMDLLLVRLQLYGDLVEGCLCMDVHCLMDALLIRFASQNLDLGRLSVRSVCFFQFPNSLDSVCRRAARVYMCTKCFGSSRAERQGQMCAGT